MKKLCAIFLSIIIILIIILSIVTIKYLKLRDQVYEYFGNYEFTYYNETSEQNKKYNKRYLQVPLAKLEHTR